MSRLQGIGTVYYGKKDLNPQDNSYVTTEWFVLLLLPIFPMKSFRVIKLATTQQTKYIVAHSSTVSYKILHEISLKSNLSQVIKTYVITYGILGLFVASWFLVNINDSLIWVPIIFGSILLILGLIKSD
ncbi:MAG: hypothetical protein WAW92_00690 [Minisyncoccia bacterium]